MPKILVTGGAGYIGSNTAQLLRRRGFEIVVVDDLSRGHQHNVKDVPFHRIALADTKALIALMNAELFDAVIHFAAYISVGESTQKPELYFSNNVGGSLSLLTAMVETNVKRLVFSSTAAVYGMPEIVPIPEESKISPVSPYGDSKVMVEKVLGWMDQFRGLRSVVLRYFNACGADPESPLLGEEHEPETHLIPLLFRAMKAASRLPFSATITTRRTELASATIFTSVDLAEHVGKLHATQCTAAACTSPGICRSHEYHACNKTKRG